MVEMVITTATERQGLVPMRLMLLVYCLQDEDVGYHHYQETSVDFPHALCQRWRSVAPITKLNLPRLLMARYMVEQPHWRQSSRRIRLFRRNRRHDRGGLVCISGIVE